MFATGNVWDYWHVFLNGLLLTIELSFIALIVGFVAGLGIGLARTYGPRPVRAACAAFTESFRSIPPLLLFFGAFYGLSYAAGVTMSPFQASVIAMTLEASAFISRWCAPPSAASTAASGTRRRRWAWASGRRCGR